MSGSPLLAPRKACCVDDWPMRRPPRLFASSDWSRSSCWIGLPDDSPEAVNAYLNILRALFNLTNATHTNSSARSVTGQFFQQRLIDRDSRQTQLCTLRVIRRKTLCLLMGITQLSKAVGQFKTSIIAFEAFSHLIRLSRMVTPGYLS